MKWVTDYQYVRALTCGHQQSSDYDAGSLLGGCRPQFGENTPLRHMDDYISMCANRVLVKPGHSAINIAVYYPVRDIWPAAPNSRWFARQTTLWSGILENQCDFDFIDDDLLAADSTTVSMGRPRGP